MGKYLDGNGLSHLISKIKTALAGKSDTGHTHAAGDVTSGTFDAARIPSLAISKITNLQTTLDGKQPAGDYWSGSKGSTSYWGLVNPEGASTGWTRTTADGLIPAASGGNSSSLGTSSWPFKNLYATNIYHNGTKLGTAATSASTDFAAASHNHAAGNITSGTLAVARGGTGAATAAVNKVFAGPSSGTDAAAPSFRSLVAADIPNLNASKITAGTLAVARGGTGAATAAVHKVFAGPSSGTDAAAPSFRSLVASDIPTLNQNTTGSAAKLTTARSLYVALGTTYDSSNPVTFDGSANKALPVSGTLPINRGGTNMTQDYTNNIATGVVFRAWGHSAYLRVEVTKNFTDGYSSFNLGTIPSGYRPAAQVVVPAMVYDTGRCCVIIVGTDGVIKVAQLGGSALGNHGVLGTASWVI